MGFSVNSVTVGGNATRPAETRAVGDTSVTKFGIAHNERRKVNGEWVDEPSFFDVEVWGAFGESVGKQIEKGTPVVVSGSLRARQWTDKDGGKRVSVEITARDVAPFQRAGNAASASQGGYQGEASGYGAPSPQSAVSAAQAQPAWSTGGGIAPSSPYAAEEDIPFAPSVI